MAEEDKSNEQPQSPQGASGTGEGFPPNQAPAPGYPPNQAPAPGYPPYQAPASGYQPHQAPAPGFAPYQMPAPLTELTGGMKFGWFAVGLLINVAGILIAWLANADKVVPMRNEAIKWSAIGAAVSIALSIVSSMVLFGSIAALVGTAGTVGSSFHW